MVIEGTRNEMKPGVGVRIDERGFVFFNDSGEPFLVRIWGEELDIWLFFWHRDGHWATFRKIGPEEAWNFAKAREPDETRVVLDLLQEVWEKKQRKR